jgi:succinate dehydrogenase / fumarate reductase iron-sulfur subunit
MNKDIVLQVRRQDSPDQPSYWEKFTIPYKPRLNVISCLMEIQRNPVNAEGKKTIPVIWECNCLEEVCGACTMVINGKARQACAALVDKLEQPIRLEPLTKFPVVRDLQVDRTIMFDNLKKVQAWIDIDGTHDIGPGPRRTEKVWTWAYELSRCMTCGCCMESCPQVGKSNAFIGPAAIAQVRLMNSHPTGEINAENRILALMEPGGVDDCGNAQNCQKACPKNLPLLTSIADVNRQVIKHGVLGWLNRD